MTHFREGRHIMECTATMSQNFKSNSTSDWMRHIYGPGGNFPRSGWILGETCDGVKQRFEVSGVSVSPGTVSLESRISSARAHE